MHKQPLGLNRRGFIRLLAITVAVVLVFYAIGLYLNHMGLQTLHGNMEALSERECSYIASQINLEVGNLITQCQDLRRIRSCCGMSSPIRGSAPISASPALAGCLISCSA